MGLVLLMLVGCKAIELGYHAFQFTLFIQVAGYVLFPSKKWLILLVVPFILMLGSVPVYIMDILKNPPFGKIHYQHQDKCAEAGYVTSSNQ